MKTFTIRLICVVMLATFLLQLQPMQGSMGVIQTRAKSSDGESQGQSHESREALMGDAKAIIAGGDHTCVQTTSGGVKCWGENEHGELGDGTVSHRLTPVDVVGLSSDVTAMTLGWHHTCALTAGSGLKCWGYNGYGALGDGTQIRRLTPVDVVGLESGVAAVSAGGGHSCALASSGGVKCWGKNDNGQLGDATTTQRLTAVDVVGLTSGVSAISAGGNHTCAITVGGGVKCWGQNTHGQLGNGTQTQQLTPVDVVGLSSGVTAITTGWKFTCALSVGGGAKCWGDGYEGQLGDGMGIPSLTPVDVVGLSSGVTAIAAGVFHTCALSAGGGIKCWGDNEVGQLGDGTTIDRLTPVDVIGLSSGVTEVTVGYSHNCAVMAGGGVKCWGNNYYGQLGIGTAHFHPTPGDVVGLSSGVTAITTGWAFTCALSAGGGIKCWGDNEVGQLGDGTKIDQLTPVDVIGLSSGVIAITAGSAHTCALTSGGGVKCWGYNLYGQLGDGTTIDRLTPIDVVGLSSGVIAITAGDNHTCAISAAGGIKCWGHNNYGQLGEGTTIGRLTPIDVVGLSSGVTEITTGTYHTCAITTGSGLKCWGYNGYGELGDGTRTQRLTPVDVVGLSSGVTAIAAGVFHTCALSAGDGVKCWGDNYYGQLGNGTQTQQLTPVDVIGLSSGVTEITAGNYHTCAISAAAGIKCWGHNYYGQLGDGTTIDRLTPIDVVGLSSGVSEITAGAYHTCAITIGSGVKCWGDNRYGALGNGIPAYRTTPVDVVWIGGVEKRPVILLPGMGASFSACMIFNNCGAGSSWSWMQTAQQYYQPLIDKFQAAGYTKANYYFSTFFYNWTRPLQENIDELKTEIDYLKSQTGASQVDLVGHSMGGLVARAYIQSNIYGNDVAQLITVGSPHLGAASAYPFWEGAYLYGVQPMQYVAFEAVLSYQCLMYRCGVSGLRAAIPSFQDILPTGGYIDQGQTQPGYLMDEGGGDKLILESTMHQRNTYLSSLNSNLSTLFSRTQVTTIVGKDLSTPARFFVHNASWWKWPDWEDGEPNWNRQNEFKSNLGDDTVVASSASLNSAQVIEHSSISHTDLPRNDQVMQDIFASLGIPYPSVMMISTTDNTQNQLPLLLILNGTAEFSITDSLGRQVGPGGITIPGAEYVSDPNDPFKLIMIPNPAEGKFDIDVTGNGEGSYIVGILDTFSPPPEIITDTTTVWDTINSQIGTSDQVTFAITYTQAISPTTSLIAVTPVIQIPVRCLDSQVTGWMVPGAMVEIRDANTNALLGSGQADNSGNFTIALAVPLGMDQRIYAWSNGFSSTVITALPYKTYLPLTTK